MRTRPYNDEKVERNQELLNDYAQGMFIVDMVAKYRISSTRIYKILKSAKKRLEDLVDNMLNQLYIITMLNKLNKKQLEEKLWVFKGQDLIKIGDELVNTLEKNSRWEKENLKNIKYITEYVELTGKTIL